MKTIVVVNHRRDWPLEVPGVELVTAQEYLTEPKWARPRRARVVNLCRQYRYQSLGYYVSLLAEARGQRALPSVMTLQDLRTSPLLQIAADELETLIQRSLKPIVSERFVLSVYFGRNLAQRHTELASALFRHFPAPLLRVQFVRDETGSWGLKKLNVMPASAIPEEHRAFAISAAQAWFAGRTRLAQRRTTPRFDLAILVDENDSTRPSNEAALKKFERAATTLEIATERIGRSDYSRLSEFDGLFIRVTTAVNHYSYRFARRAEAERLVVMDDPLSILRCTNKVYLAEMLERARIASPKTRIVSKENVESVGGELGFPLILKRPDSSTSLGVVKVESHEEMVQQTNLLLEGSDLLIAQEFLPTEYDWRIGVLEGQPLYAVKYFMAPHHWQIVNHAAYRANQKYGDSKCFALDEVPRDVLKIAVDAAGLIGRGLYGVDVKESGGKLYVIEVNDNPSMDRGVEDALLGDDLYRTVMSVFLRRMELRREGKERS